MGGLALKHFGARRMSKAEYTPLVATVLGTIGAYWRSTYPSEVLSFRDKGDYGDADIVLRDVGLDWHILHSPDGTSMPAWFATMLDILGVPQGHYHMNKPVYSVYVKGLQVDLIVAAPDEYDSSLVYYSWNDLGNLMGRVAHKMGFKLGHRGLELPMRTSEHGVTGAITVSKDMATICAILGYDYERWRRGFSTIAEVWQYAASSPYFSPHIYDLSEANAKARVRDSKRAVYTGFVEFIERNKAKLPNYDWKSEPREYHYGFHMGRACELVPGLGDKVNAHVAEREAGKARAARWNGNVVAEWVGLDPKKHGEQLGAFIRECKTTDWYAKMDQMDDAELRIMTQAHYEGWE